VVNIANKDTAAAHILQVISDGKTFVYEVQADGRIAFALLETPTTDKITLIDVEASLSFEGGFADLSLPADISTLNLKLRVEEKDAAGVVLAAQERTGIKMVAADIGAAAPPGDIVITAAGGD
jgi:hypothetical protein